MVRKHGDASLSYTDKHSKVDWSPRDCLKQCFQDWRVTDEGQFLLCG